MGLVSTWLNGIGLGYAFPAFRAAGIVTPASLAELDLAHYEALGIHDPADRRKLFYLVQRIKMATETPSCEQKEIDDIVSKTWNTGGESAGDANDNIEEDQIVENETFEKKLRVIPQSATSLQSSVQKAPSKEYTASSLARRNDSKENTRLPIVDSSKINISSRTRSQALPLKTYSLYDNAVEDENESSDWAEESDVVVADDEASLSSRRTSRRLQEKKMKGTDSAMSGKSPEEAEESTSNSGRQVSHGSIVSRGYSGDEEMSSKKRLSSSRMRRSSTSDLDADDESSITASATRKSGVQPPRTRRYESSKLQNPTTRTGKQLSTIPSDSVAPMSPLVKLSVSRLEADIYHQQKVERKKNTDVVSSTKKRLGRSLSQNDVTSSKDHDQEPGNSEIRSISLSGSDTDTQTNRRSDGRKCNVFSGSDSEVQNARRRSRLSSGEISSASDTERQTCRRRNRTSLGGIQPSKTKIIKPSRKSVTELETVKLNASKGAVFVHGTAEDTSWSAQVSKLRTENQANHDIEQTSLLNDEFDDDEMRIRVVVRKRPMSNSELSNAKEVDVIHPLDYDGYGRILVYQAKTRVDLTRQIETIPFAFDNVFDEISCNKVIYERTVRNLIPGVFLDGQWASVFAYGQTGSGKTFTMMGCNVTGVRAGSSTDDTDNYGLYYMAARDVFEMANKKEFRHMSIGVSLFEIYGGKLFDLLNNRNHVKCLEDHKGKVCFPGLSEHPVSDADELMSIIENGANNRSTGTTSKNADSSRSHAIVQICVRKTVGRKQNIEHGRLTFIDLAGSERGADTSTASRATRLEGAEINTSLLALKEVIRALATGDSLVHIPFRGSKLTQVLKESFVGENARSVMIACIAPNMSNCEHTLNTLRYADRVKERNAKTGALSASVSHNRTTSSKRFSRQSNSSNIQKVSYRDDEPDICSEDYVDLDGSEIFEDCQTGSFEEADAEIEESKFRYIHSSPLKLDQSLSTDSVTLNEVLGESGHFPELESKGFSHGSSGQHRNDVGKTGSALISTHRTVMASMLALCKDEMAIVNKADADRDTIDSYLSELEGIHERQSEMLTKLHEELLEFRGSHYYFVQNEEHTLSDDDSFEDLRD